MVEYYDEELEELINYYENTLCVKYDPMSDDYVVTYPIDENEPMCDYVGCKRTKKDGYGGYCEHCPNLDNCL